MAFTNHKHEIILNNRLNITGLANGSSLTKKLSYTYLSLKVGGEVGPENYAFGAFLHKHDNFARLLSHTFMLIYNRPGYEIL